jgi:hypothetical protein
MSIFELLHQQKPIFAPFWRSRQAKSRLIVYAVCSYR